MNIKDFALIYKLDENKVYDLFNSYNMESAQMRTDIRLLMPVVMKINFLKTKYPDVLKKDYENGNLKIMAETSKEHKAIYELLESGASISSVISLMIESQINAVHEMYADLQEYYFTAYRSVVETFGGEMPERRTDAYMYELFDHLIEILT